MASKNLVSMDNLEINQRQDGKVEIVFDPKRELRDSSTGNSRIICSSAGNVRVDALDFSIGINAYRKKK